MLQPGTAVRLLSGAILFRSSRDCTPRKENVTAIDTLLTANWRFIQITLSITDQILRVMDLAPHSFCTTNTSADKLTFQAPAHGDWRCSACHQFVLVSAHKRYAKRLSYLQ